MKNQMIDQEKSREAVLEKIKLFVLDMDGTFYLGERLLDGSLPFIEKVRETGRTFLFFTNNSSRTPELYMEKLARMGCGIGREDIMTSGDVTIQYLKTFHAGEAVYLLGTEVLRRDFSENGILLWPNEPVSSTASFAAESAAASAAAKRPDVVVAAFDMELTYAKLERACTFIREGAVFLATHPDVNCPTETGFIPDCGAFCAAIECSTGRKPKYLGKPCAETLEMVVAAKGIPKEEIAFVGDRLYTDVATGVNGGATGLLVLSGETKEGDLKSSAIRPDAVFRDLGEIAEYLD